MIRFSYIVLLVITCVCPAAEAGNNDNWFNTFYQYRLPVVMEAKETGWHVVPVSQSDIVSRINRLEEMQFDPVWFAYNHLKIVEVDSDGRVIDPDPQAGFYLIPEKEELVSSDVIDKKDTVTIETEAGAYYLLRYRSEGADRSPAFRYDAIWPVGHELRRNAYQSSYEPKMLPKQSMQHERLLLSDGSPMALNINNQWVKGLKNISLKKACVRFLVNLKEPGRKYWMIYYQPLNGQNLVIPGLRRRKIPERSAKILRIGNAEKYTGDAGYRLAGNDCFTAWFAETTVKLTPNTPAPEKSSPVIRISSAANEAQSFQIVLNPKKSFVFKEIKSTALKSGEEIIPAASIGFYMVDWVPITVQSDVTPIEYLGPVGDALVKVTERKVYPLDGNCILWGTVKTPSGTKPGIYRGSIVIKSGKVAPVTLPVELEVYDFELPEYSPFRTSFGGSHITQTSPDKKTQADYHHLFSKEDIKKLARKYYDIMAENKFTPHNAGQYSEIGMNWSPPPEGFNVDKPENYFRLYDWDFSEFNADMKHYIDELKVNAFTVVHINPSVIQRFKHLPGKEVKEYNRQAGHISLAWQVFREMTYVGINKTKEDEYIEITLAQYDRLLMDFYRTFAENLEKHGWLDYAYILVDETHYRGFDEFLHFLRLLKSDPLTARIKIAWTIQGIFAEHYLTEKFFKSCPAFTYRENPDDKNYAFNGLIDIYIPQAQANYQWWEKHYFTDYAIGPEREKLWTYVTSSARLAIDCPGINNRAFALELFNNGGGGYLVWASFMWDSVGCKTDNPWEYPWTVWGNGALSYFYPPRKNGPASEPDWTIIPSLRVMTYREGVDDYEYAKLLEDLIAKAEAGKADCSGEKAVLSDISKFFSSSVHWSQNDAWYAELRDRMARAIVGLKSQVPNPKSQTSTKF